MDIGPIGRGYALPTETLPGETLAAALARLTRFEALCHAHGVTTGGTRVERYSRYLAWRAADDSPLETLDRGIFVDGPDSPVQHGLDRFLYVLRETHELAWIGEGLRGLDIPGLDAKLGVLTSGADFAALDRNVLSRNTQYELRVASYFARAGYDVDLSGLTDIVAVGAGRTIHVECKRIGSAKQLSKRIKEAVAQLRARMPRSTSTHGHFGLVAADVTKVAFTRNGLTMAVTPEHARDIIQEKLKLIGRQLDRPGGGAMVAKRILGLWLQIHIPSLVTTPPMPTTRFSSYFIPNSQPTLRAEGAEKALWFELSNVKTENDDDTPAEPLQPRAGVRIPVGTQVSWDEDLLAGLQQGGPFPDLPDEHVVMSVAPPGSDAFEDFSFLDLRFLLAPMSPEDRRAALADEEQARTFLLGGLLSRRHPYADRGHWLDADA